MLPRELSNEKGRNLRTIGKRLVIHRRQTRDDSHRLLRGNVEFGVFSSQMLGNALGEWRLVIGVFGKTHGEGPHSAGRLPLHHRNYSRGIEPTRKKCAERHV